MRPLLIWMLAAVWFGALAGCSGGRSERIACGDISQCQEPDICHRGYCTAIDSARVSARAMSAGVDVPVLVIDAAGNTCEASACTDLPYGSQVLFRASEAPGFRFTGWSGSPECAGTAHELIIPSLTVDTDCVAHYVRRLRVNGVVAGADMGGITASADDPLASCLGASCDVDANTTVRLVADPRWGETFLGWTGAGCGEQKTLEITVQPTTADITCTAVFTRRIVVSARAMNVEAAIEVSSDEPGAVCEPGSCLMHSGSSATLRAPDVPGFRFAGWSGTSLCIGSAPTLAFERLSEPQACVATYLQRFQVSGSAAGATPPPPIVAWSSDVNATCNGAACQVDKGGSATLLAGSSTGFRLSHWSGTGCEGQTGAAVELTEVGADVACVANYAQGIAVIGAVVGAAGEVTASSSSPGAQCTAGRCNIDAGGDVTLTAPEVEGYRFAHWEGDPGCEGQSLTITFTQVTQSRTCYARYAARFLVRGVASPGEGGAVRATSPTAGALCNNGSCTIDGGGEVTLEAMPLAGYRFSGWSGSEACTGAAPALRLSNIVGNVTCQANFVGRVTVSGVASPATAGGVTASSDSGGSSCQAGSCAVDLGSRVGLTAVPAPGFRFTNWSGCSDSAEPTLTFEGVRRDVSCQANFVPLRFTVTGAVAPIDAGSVVASSSGSNAACQGGNCTVDFGSAVTLTATAGTGFRFTAWSGCQNGTEATLTLPNVQANTSCTANFVRISVTASATAAPANGGSVSATSNAQGASCNGASCTVPFGSNVTFAAAPAPGYDFTNWSGCSGSANATISLPINAAVSCQANFRLRAYTVQAVAGSGGTIASATTPDGTCRGASCNVSHGGSATFVAAANANFEFGGWSGDGCVQDPSNPLRANVADVSGDVTCNARFTAIPSFTVRAVAGNGGRIESATAQNGSCDGASCSVRRGGSAAFVASINANFEFAGWTGAGCSADPSNPLRVTVGNVTGAVTCTASFTAIPSFTVRAVAGDGGGIASATPQNGSCMGNDCSIRRGGSVAFVASVNANFDFVGWSGSGCMVDPANALRVTVVNVTANVTCTASFSAVPSFRVQAVAGMGGRISSATTPDGSCNGSTCSVRRGGSAAFVAEAGPNFDFAGWSGGGCQVDPQNRLRVTVNGVSGEVTCTAAFSAVPTFTVRGVAVGNGGTIAASAQNGMCINNSCSVLRGGSATFVASVNANFEFGGWSGSGCVVDPGNRLRVDVNNVNSDVTCTATFTSVPSFTVQATAEGGRITAASTPDGSCTGASCSVLRGGSAAFEAAANPNFTFASWSGGCVPDGQNPLRATVSNVTADITCTANFRAVPSFTVRGVAGEGGEITEASAENGECQDGVCTVFAGGSATFTADADDGFTFAGWSGCTQNAAGQAVVSNVNADVTCTANFRAIPQVTVGAEAEPNDGVMVGSVTASAGGNECRAARCTVPPETPVSLRAEPVEGWSFSQWSCSDDSASRDNPLTISAIRDVTCRATFEPILF